MKFCALVLFVSCSLSAFAAQEPVVTRRGLLLNSGVSTIFLSTTNSSRGIMLNSKGKTLDLKTSSLAKGRWNPFELSDHANREYLSGLARIVARPTFQIITQLSKHNPRPTPAELVDVINAMENACEPFLLPVNSTELFVIED